MLQHENGKLWRSRLYLVDGPPEVGGISPEVHLEAMGRFESLGSFTFRQVAQWIAVHVVAEGRGVMKTDRREFSVGAGDLFTFFPGQLVDYHDHPQAPWRYTWFVVKGECAESLLGHCGIDRKHPHRTGGMHGGLEQVAREVESAYGRPGVSPVAAVSLAWRLVRELEAKDLPAPRPGLAERAQLVFDHHYGEPLSVEALAAKLEVSRATLFRAFRTKFGASPKTVLNRLRLERAMRLLRASDRSVKEIASDCGYASEAYFSRAFKQRTGQPPGRWRNR